MKEILKYLRQLKSLTQEEAAAGISVSRQTYSKYEKGTVVPSDETVRRLAALYNVSPDFIRKNEVPKISEKPSAEYHIEENYGSLKIASPAAALKKDYGYTSPKKITRKNKKTEKAQQVFEAEFDGEEFYVYDLEKIRMQFPEGKRFKIIPETDEEENERRRQAWETIQEYAGKINIPENFDYKEELYKALKEKYDSIN